MPEQDRYKGWWEVLAFMFIACLYVLFNKHGFIVSPDREFAWKVLGVYDPSLFQKDVLTTLSNRVYYSFLAWPLAFLLRSFSLQWIFFVGHLVTTFFYLYFVYRIGKTIFKDGFVAFLVSLGVFVIKPVLVDASLYPTCFHHRNVSWVLQLLAIDLFLNRKLSWASFVIGIAFLITPYAVAHLTFMIVFVILFQWKQFSFRTLIRSAGIFLILISPMVAWRLRFSDLSMVSAGDEWWQFVRTYVPSYFFPSTLWRPENGGMATLLMGFVWPFYFLASFVKGYVSYEKEEHRTVVLLMVGLLVLLFIGYFFAEVIPWVTVAQLMIFRSHRFFVLFSIIYFSFYLIMRFRDEQKSLPSKLLVGATAAAFLSSKMILCTALAAVDCLTWLMIRNEHMKKVIQIGVSVALGIAVVIPASLQPDLFNRLFHVDLPFGAFWLLTSLFYQGGVASGPASAIRNNTIRVEWLAYVTLFVILLMPRYWGVEKNFIKNPVQTILKQVQWPWNLPYSSAHHSLFEWVQRETPLDSIFLIPLMDDELNRYFKVVTRRGEVINVSNSMAVISLEFAREWERIYTVFRSMTELPFEKIRDRALKRTTDEIEGLYDEYPFDYYVSLQGAQPLDFPVAFENDRFVVYQVRPD